jgi:hypothetical protein
MPSGLDGTWPKKRAARPVSKEIKSAVGVDGYYRRKLVIKRFADLKSSTLNNQPHAAYHQYAQQVPQNAPALDGSIELE